MRSTSGIAMSMTWRVTALVLLALAVFSWTPAMISAKSSELALVGVVLLISGIAAIVVLAIDLVEFCKRKLVRANWESKRED
jgi:hypothetical protein